MLGAPSDHADPPIQETHAPKSETEERPLNYVVCLSHIKLDGNIGIGVRYMKVSDHLLSE